MYQVFHINYCKSDLTPNKLLHTSPLGVVTMQHLKLLRVHILSPGISGTQDALFGQIKLLKTDNTNSLYFITMYLKLSAAFVDYTANLLNIYLF